MQRVWACRLVVAQHAYTVFIVVLHCECQISFNNNRCIIWKAGISQLRETLPTQKRLRNHNPVLMQYITVKSNVEEMLYQEVHANILPTAVSDARVFRWMNSHTRWCRPQRGCQNARIHNHRILLLWMTSGEAPQGRHAGRSVAWASSKGQKHRIRHAGPG